MNKSENAKTEDFGGDWERTERDALRLVDAKTGTGSVFTGETLFRDLVPGSRIRPHAGASNLINIILP